MWLSFSNAWRGTMIQEMKQNVNIGS